MLILFKSFNSITFVLFYLVAVIAPQRYVDSYLKDNALNQLFMLQLYKTNRP